LESPLCPGGCSQPELKGFHGYAELLQHSEGTSLCVAHLQLAPDAAMLMYASNKKVKIIHHFYFDMKSPLIPQGTEKI
jgi:hypothetical protein